MIHHRLTIDPILQGTPTPLPPTPTLRRTRSCRYHLRLPGYRVERVERVGWNCWGWLIPEMCDKVTWDQSQSVDWRLVDFERKHCSRTTWVIEDTTRKACLKPLCLPGNSLDLFLSTRDSSTNMGMFTNYMFKRKDCDIMEYGVMESLLFTAELMVFLTSSMSATQIHTVYTGWQSGIADTISACTQVGNPFLASI